MTTRRDASAEHVKQALYDVQLYHANKQVVPPGRARSLLRQNSAVARATGGPARPLLKRDPRLSGAELVGSGAEGAVLKVLRADWDEQAVSLTDQQRRHPLAIKLCTVVVRKDAGESQHSRAALREVVQGFLAHAANLQFVAPLRDWGLCDVSQGQPAPDASYRIGHRLPQTATLDGRPPIESTDYMPPDVARRVRERALHYERRRHNNSKKNNGAAAAPTAAAEVREEYLRLRQHELSADSAQLPVMITEQDYCGHYSLGDLLSQHCLLIASDTQWRFVRNLFFVVLQALEWNQQQVGWQHGDCSLSNIVLSEWTCRRQLPVRFQRFRVPSSAGPAQQCDITPEALQMMTGGVVYLPWFVDLSRSALRLDIAERLLPDCPQRSDRFLAQMIDYRCGYASNQPRYAGRADLYSRTLDVRFCGLSFAHLIVEQLRCNRLSLSQLDARPVRLAAAMIAPGESWVAIRNFDRVSNDSPARSSHWQSFMGKMLFVWYYLQCLATRCVQPTAQSYRPFLPAADNIEPTLARRDEWYAAWNDVWHDLSPYMSWALARHPDLERDDVCVPQRALLWDVFYV